MEGVTASTRALGGPPEGSAATFVSLAGAAGVEAALGSDGEDALPSGGPGGGVDEHAEHARSARTRGRAIL